MSTEDRTLEMARWAAVQAWHQEVFAAAKVIDPAATLSDTSGNVPLLVVGGKEIRLSGNDYVAAQQLGQTPGVWLAKAIQGYAPPTPPVLPDPGPTPAASDAWTKVPVGTIITVNGKLCVVDDDAFGQFPRVLTARELAERESQTPAPSTVAGERQDVVTYARGVLLVNQDENVQASFKALLAWLSKRAK